MPGRAHLAYAPGQCARPGARPSDQEVGVGVRAIVCTRTKKTLVTLVLSSWEAIIIKPSVFPVCVFWNTQNTPTCGTPWSEPVTQVDFSLGSQPLAVMSC